MNIRYAPVYGLSATENDEVKRYLMIVIIKFIMSDKHLGSVEDVEYFKNIYNFYKQWAEGELIKLVNNNNLITN